MLLSLSRLTIVVTRQPAEMSHVKEEEGIGTRIQNGESALLSSDVEMHAEAAPSNSRKPHVAEQVSSSTSSSSSSVSRSVYFSSYLCLLVSFPFWVMCEGPVPCSASEWAFLSF